MTNLRHEARRYSTNIDESFLRGLGSIKTFFEHATTRIFRITQLDTFYNALNAMIKEYRVILAAVETLDKMPENALEFSKVNPSHRWQRFMIDNIQEYVSQAAAANFNQGNTILDLR
ncbi:hypothetical protein Tco_0519596 [Tanacetum coccineum]